ncbi:serine hydrolase domain-containing protein [Zhihengliuella flava]|uniref:CubicO group peptidase (Beta-lactamase class C family) n=1 Tax=Zhihengliuella flava TaxID=1285193 RepID=A0A931DCC4_9MICC|nr:serine hydrolase domain-containing protein [Zhihengliuella flava]MBG6084263.1 CubicO group peptidase (beta-lactamase class C family) [Zhihengliuella flava]
MIDPRFAAVADLLDRFVEEDPAYAGQLCVYLDGAPVLDLAVGQDHAPQAGGFGADDEPPALRREALTGVFSCSKGAGAVVMGLLVQDGVLDLDARVAEYWPEYAAAGKEATTVRQALSHQAGALGVPGGFSLAEYNESERAAAQLAAAPPAWRPGITHAYHGLTIGVLMEELVRRTTGESLQQVYEDRVRSPYGIDFYLGLPEAEEFRYRNVLKPAAAPLPFIDPFGYTGLAFNSTGVFEREDGTAGELLDLPNHRAVRAGGHSSAGGVANARGLARLYAVTSTGVVDDAGSRTEPLFSAETTRLMTEDQVFGADRASGELTAFGIGFMKPAPQNSFGSVWAYGHNGANGSFGWADPAYGLAFGYVPLRGEDNGNLSRNGILGAAVRQARLAATVPRA